jgi:hypothetical protein
MVTRCGPMRASENDRVAGLYSAWLKLALLSAWARGSSDAGLALPALGLAVVLWRPSAWEWPWVCLMSAWCVLWGARLGLGWAARRAHGRYLLAWHRARLVRG